MHAAAATVPASPTIQKIKIFIFPKRLDKVYPNLTVSPTQKRVIGLPIEVYLVYIYGSDVIL